LRRIALIPVVALGLALATPAAAQLNDNRGLYDRIDRLERDIQTMQAQAARGGTTVVNSPAVGGGTSVSPPPSIPTPARVTQLDERVDQLEDLVRALTGKVEEATYKAQQTQKQLERMQADIDLRFKELGPATPAPATSTQPPATPPQPGGVSMPGPGAGGGVLAVPKNSAEGPGPAPGPQALGAVSDKDIKRPPAAEPPPGQAPVLTPPASVLIKDPQALYKDAYDRLQRNDTAGAEDEFKTFLKKYPDHQLAGSAQFWLANIVFVRQDYANSALAFLEAYKKYPKTTKAPDMLWMASQSFAKLDPPRKPEACKTLEMLFRDHPNMPDHVRRGATQDKQKLGCK